MIHPENPCRCHNKLKSLIREGFVNPDNFLFYKEKVRSIEDTLNRNRDTFNRIHSLKDAQKLFRAHPFYDPPDFQNRLGNFLNAEMRRLFDI